MRRVIQGLLLISALGAVASADEPRAKLPERAEPAFNIYVFTAAGSDAKSVTEKWQKNLITAATRVGEAAGRERDWLKVVKTREQAELVLEVTDIGYRKGRPGAKEQHLLEGTLAAFGGEPEPLKGQAEVDRDVPAAMAARVVTYCRANYAALMAKRTP
jgi:hypothetical protein